MNCFATARRDGLARSDRAQMIGRPRRHHAMSSHKHATKTALVLALALGAMAPAAASARLNLNPVGPTSPPPNASAKSTEGIAPSPRPTVQIVRVSTPAGFDWGDAGIG